jgi:vacuolar-type H+-ATPase subunit H
LFSLWLINRNNNHPEKQGGLYLENIIKQVIETEYRAQRIVNEIKKEQLQSVRDVDLEINLIKEKIFSAAKQKAESIKAEKLKYAKEQSNKIITEAHKKVSSMRAMLENDRELLVKQLYDNVLNYRR